MEYTSNSQRARVFSELWVAKNAYCLACTNESLKPTPANTKARDFECDCCGHPYELKSSLRPFQRMVVDGAYRAMTERIEDGTVASFLLLPYDQHAAVTHLTAIHRSFITPEVIEARSPLSVFARRAGWVGCNLFTAVAAGGRAAFAVGSRGRVGHRSKSRFPSGVTTKGGRG